MTSTEEEIKRIVADHLGIDRVNVTPESAFAADLGIDAKQAALLRRKVQEQLHVSLPKDDAKGLNTVGDLIGYIEGKSA